MAQQAAPRTVLLVENEPSLRQLLRRWLLKLRYQLLEAPHENQALAVAEQCRTQLDLLLTDVIMPKMNGFALAARVTSRHPETQVLFITGHAADRPDVEDTLRRTPHAFLLKPFTATALTQKVQDPHRRPSSTSLLLFQKSTSAARSYSMPAVVPVASRCWLNGSEPKQWWASTSAAR